MQYNIVTNFKINQILKSKSQYYKVSLGLSSTMESNSGDRNLNKSDDFAFYYNNLYRTTIYGQGSIGNIRFYTDHYIKEDKIAFYYDKEEFIFDFDEKMTFEKGVDFYLGHLIKKIETEHEDRIKKKEEEKEIKKQEVGNPDQIFQNPGAVKYSDLKAYMEKMRTERLKT